VVVLAEGPDAFAARALLAAAAERSLDVQYYIWHNDTTGTLLLDALRCAADRGVRVRLLLDDNNTPGLDPLLAALDAHPNIEVRLFNPFKHRRWRIVDYLTDFARVNRRMHNKSFTADNQVTIIGGRNVGDEYFGAGRDVLFVDLDVLAIGPVVNDVSNDFERYWESQSSWPVQRVLPTASRESLSEVAAAAATVTQSPAAMSYVDALAGSSRVRELLSGQLPFEWATTTMLSDPPAKVRGRTRHDGLLWTRLKKLVGDPASELHMISPYFVPGKEGVVYFAALAKAGVKVKVLTNSVEATDVAAVHVGYAKHRRPLLEAKIDLFEMKRGPSPLGSGSHRRRLIGRSGSSRSSLHAKTFSVDGTRIFIGSFNFDPRSILLNTELGFLIDSPALALAVADAFTKGIPGRSYRVQLNEGRRLQWLEQTEGGPVVHQREPGAGFWLRLGLWVMSRFPIEWLL
jgi:putative cardiolipin synthase